MAIVTRCKEAQTPQSFAYSWVHVKVPRIIVDSTLGTILGSFSVREFVRGQNSAVAPLTISNQKLNNRPLWLNEGNPCRASIFGCDGNQRLERRAAAHLRRASPTISISTSRACFGLLTSRKNAIRALRVPSCVFKRT
jgi:hypothetical protein